MIILNDDETEQPFPDTPDRMGWREGLGWFLAGFVVVVVGMLAIRYAVHLAFAGLGY